jgi:hypothetical protein
VYLLKVGAPTVVPLTCTTAAWLNAPTRRLPRASAVFIAFI